jgi:hypothetical protein
MSINSKKEFLSSKKVQLLVTLGGVIVALLNIYLVAKLSPLYQITALNTQAIQAASEDIQEVKTNFEQMPNKEDIILLREEVGEIQKDMKEVLKAQARLEGLLLAK